ncbi:MAG: hypothetical protein Q8Q12_10290 [bacterium]|nr:hypothetical protein [bacterium]
MSRARVAFFGLWLLVVSCGTVPDPPPLYDEEAVLRVWDVFDEHYGADTLFECELHTVRSGQISIHRPYEIGHIAVVGYSSTDDAPILFRVVPSAPGENEFVASGATLSFHESYEGQKLFVAWVPQHSPVPSPQAPCGIERQ